MTTEKPSIESLREIVYGMKEPSTTAEIEALDAALDELEAYRDIEPAINRQHDALRARAEKAEASLDALQTWYGDHEEREAACCPEDTRCTDYIGLLLDTLKMIDATTAALRAENEALVWQVWRLLQEGEMTQPGDEILVDKEWEPIRGPFRPAPSPDYTSHVKYRRKIADELTAERARADALAAENEEMRSRLDSLPDPNSALQNLGEYLATLLDTDHWNHAVQYLEAARIAQQETAAHDARVRREALEEAAKKCAEAYWAMVAPKDHAAMHPTIEFWRDALGLEPMSSAEHEALAAIEPRHPEIVMVDDLAMLVRLLVHSIRKHSPDNETARKAMDYLRRHELQGSPLRTTILSPAPDAAKPNNQQEQP